MFWAPFLRGYFMNSTPKVSYQGRMVYEEPFRVFVYGMNNQKKLVETWKDFESSISTGSWFEYPVLEEKEHKQKKNKKWTDAND